MTDEEKAPTEEDIQATIDGWRKLANSIPAMESQIKEMIEDGDPCLLCVEVFNMLASIPSILKETIESLVEQVRSGEINLADEHERSSIASTANLYNKWHSVTTECILRISVAAHKQLLGNGVEPSSTCLAPTSYTEQTKN